LLFFAARLNPLSSEIFGCNPAYQYDIIIKQALESTSYFELIYYVLINLKFTTQMVTASNQMVVVGYLQTYFLFVNIMRVCNFYSS